FRSIDTAGLKRRTRIEGDIDFYAMRRAEQALLRAEVAVLVLDVSMGVTDTDQKIAGLIDESHRACVIVANKWDLSEGKEKHKEAFIQHVRDELHFLFFAPVVFTSALNGTGIKEVMAAIEAAHHGFHHRATTGELNAIIEAIYEHNPPQSWKGRRGKIYYATQVGVAPPHIVLQVNSSKLFIDSYIRYMYKALYTQLPLAGSPIRLSLRSKPRKEGSR
ncbi:MAG TPA: GTP-binding protein, partial [bacterium]|nr:GTP-binding protein [bacterium]